MDIGKDLTKRQQEIFDFNKKYSAKYGYPPTVRDIGKAVGLASSSTVHAHLANLEKAGLLRRDPSKPRAIEMLDRATTGVVDAVKSVVGQGGLPLVGQVAAGQPILAEENIEEYVSVPELAGGDEGEYVLRIRGESMKNAGILEGDYVVVRRQDTATDGEIVVALVGEDATVKRFFREEDHVRLQPENETMEPIRSREVRVLGRVVGGLRTVTGAPPLPLRPGPRGLRSSRRSPMRCAGRGPPSAPAPPPSARSARARCSRAGRPARAWSALAAATAARRSSSSDSLPTRCRPRRIARSSPSWKKA